MLIIFEGADGSGKTTLIKQLNTCIICELTQDIRYEIGSYIKYFNMCINDEIYLCDRSFLSDLVYRLCDDQKPDYMKLDDMVKILKQNTKIVYCETDYQFDDSIERGEDNITDRAKANEIRKVYNIVISMLEKFTDVPIYRYNWYKDDVSNVIEFIKKEV